jgi:hypothetical protein
LLVDIGKAVEMLRDTDVHHMKKKFSQIYCKLIITEKMLDKDYTDEEEEFKEGLDFSSKADQEPQKAITIDITIK